MNHHRFIFYIGWAASLYISCALTNRAPANDATVALAAQAKYIPQRLDDIAWENDRIAHRIYGPALVKTDFAGSGIDVWVKSTRKMIIDEWYQRADYHKDHGGGLDFYDVQHSRGCGGLGIWDGRQLYVSSHWSNYQIDDAGPKTGTFTVDYAKWPIQDGHSVSESRRFTLPSGTNFDELQSTLTSDVPELTVGIGITKRKGAGGRLFEDKEKGVMIYWQPPEKNGVIGLAVIVDPKDIVGFTEDDLNYLVLVKEKSGQPWTYREGACWSKGLDFHDFASWKAYTLTQAGAK